MTKFREWPQAPDNFITIFLKLGKEEKYDKEATKKYDKEDKHKDLCIQKLL